ncbi:efflux RND transporter periplasmic adaptor subunit [Azospira restricta]|uniref:Efflux RND transporter periplasmic adaptor subunit n=1 Tax=Azospira restricta TaxID=404405 RepID=A0A974SR94_9RHOO|nr:efflux RND transporter periplasmic adaptor subunit [Azospira restricta]QRJ64987.1 efflux RND transporter periplasmic adaptor subunit [Azospira restricta]
MLQRRNIPFPLPVLVAGLLPLVLAACGDATSANDPRTRTPLVRVGTVAAAVHAERSFTGVVAARVQSDLGFRVPGKLLERLVDSGQTVRRGQPLMRIDPTDLRLATRAHDEAVAAATARARQTAEDEARYRDLVAAGAVSASAYDKIKAAADSARAELKAAQAQADVARNEAGYAVLLADADGVVVETLAEPGQVVAAGQVVVRVAHAGRREALIHLPETLRPAIGSAAQAALYGSGLTGAAKLRQLSDAANPQTRTFEARYVLAGELANAPLGSTVTVRIAEGQPSAQEDWQVPIGALFDAGKGPGVWVVSGEPAQVSWRPVAVQRIADDGARVSGQIKPGDRIVTLGAHLLRDGEQVRVAGQAAGAASEGVRP